MAPFGMELRRRIRRRKRIKKHRSLSLTKGGEFIFELFRSFFLTNINKINGYKKRHKYARYGAVYGDVDKGEITCKVGYDARN